MKTRKHILSATVFLLIFSLVGAGFMHAPATAAFVNRIIIDEHDDALQAIKRGEIMSYSQIRKIAERQLKGRVVDLKLRRTNRGWQYFLRISRNDGRVIAAVVDAKTGKVLRPR